MIPVPILIGTQSRVLLACEITNGSAVMGFPFGLLIGEVAPCPPLTACYCGFRDSVHPGGGSELPFSSTDLCRRLMGALASQLGVGQRILTLQPAFHASFNGSLK